MKAPAFLTSPATARGLRVLFGLYILYATVRTLLIEPGMWDAGAPVGTSYPIIGLASLELVAVTLFFIPRHRVLGEVMLLGIFLVVSAIAALEGGSFRHLILYAVIVILFMQLEGRRNANT